MGTAHQPGCSKQRSARYSSYRLVRCSDLRLVRLGWAVCIGVGRYTGLVTWATGVGLAMGAALARSAITKMRIDVAQITVIINANIQRCLRLLGGAGKLSWDMVGSYLVLGQWVL